MVIFTIGSIVAINTIRQKLPIFYSLDKRQTIFAQLKNDRGSILGIAMIYFLVFSITGMAILTYSAQARLNVQNHVHNIQNQYAVESTLNKALWRINNGSDSLANFEENGVIASYIDSNQTLSVSTNRWDQPVQISVEIIKDYPFNHGVAVLVDQDTSKFSVTTLPDHGMRIFASLPSIDTSYYLQNAVQIYTSGTTNFDDTLVSGIHYVQGGTVFLKNGAYLEGSLVVMGKLKVVGTNVSLNAVTDSNGVYIPALIVVDSSADISSNPGIEIKGAIFSTGPFDIKGGNLTGPLVGSSIVFTKNLIINDEANEKYYCWPPGFGDRNSYNWPKQIKKRTWK